MDGLPIGIAVAAGMVAVVNPCGFALLPAYASLLIAGDDSPNRAASIRRSLAFAGAMTIGFTAVFGAFGLLLASLTNISGVQRYLPWFTLVFGVVLVALGLWLLAGRQLPGLRLAVRGPKIERSARSTTLFGATYATASLTCTMAPFLATVVASFRADSFVGGLTVFGAYALGMGMVVVAVSLVGALAQTTVVTWMRRAGRHVSRASGVLLAIAGAYVAYYGWYSIRVLRSGAADDPIIRAGESVQRWLADGVASLGVGGLAAIVGALGVIAAALVVRRRRASVHQR